MARVPLLAAIQYGAQLAPAVLASFALKCVVSKQCFLADRAAVGRREQLAHASTAVERILRFEVDRVRIVKV